MKYLCDPHIIPAVMPRDLDELKQFAERFGEFTDYIQLDVMDGSFAPNPHWPFADAAQRAELEQLAARERQLPQEVSFEVHLMVNDPAPVGELFARAGARRIIAHIESFQDVRDIPDVLARWKVAGAQETGIAIKLDTPISALAEVSGACDVIQVMSIQEIGYQGKSFDERALARIEELHALYPTMMVAVDGGVTEATVELLVRAGANRLVVGGALTESMKPETTYAKILERAMQGCAPLSAESAI